MTIDEAIKDIKDNIKPVVGGKSLDMAIEALERQRWIPVTERLPEIDKEVLVTDGELCRGCSLFEPQDNEDGLYQWEDNYGHWYEFETWVAWMPLPEPARLENDGWEK